MRTKLLALAASALLFCGCMTQAERFTPMTPAEIHQWSDEELCTNGYRNNPAIKAELLQRNLVTEKEFEYIFLPNEHNNFPAKGMRRCAVDIFELEGASIKNKAT